MSWENALRTALHGVAANKLRAALTALGVIIGVASVVATLALGNGARAAVEASFRILGSNQIQVSVKEIIEDGELVPYGHPLTYEDGLLLPTAVELVDRVEMQVRGAAKVRRGRAVLDMMVTGTTADAMIATAAQGQVQPIGRLVDEPLSARAFIGHGRFFTPAEVLSDAALCVLGHDTALFLFEGDDPLGETIWVARQRCLVVGVLAELESTDPQQRAHTKPNDALYLPIGAAIGALFDDAPFSNGAPSPDGAPPVMITAHVIDESRMEQARAQIAAFLRGRHAIEKKTDGQYDDDFYLTTKQDILGAQQEAARTFSLLLIALAAVSLVVGGIGIMNVMLVGVSERTREIGVRLAVGARRSDLVAQFLLEATLISGAGGLVGVAVGILSVPLAAALNHGVALLDPGSIPLALGVALLTGTVFGLYPAARASRLDPIAALRHE